MNATQTSEPAERARKLLTATEAAAYVDLSVQCLANYRCSGVGPAYYKIGHYCRYDEGDLDAWMRSRRYTSTSQETAG